MVILGRHPDNALYRHGDPRKTSRQCALSAWWSKEDIQTMRFIGMVILGRHPGNALYRHGDPRKTSRQCALSAWWS